MYSNVVRILVKGYYDLTNLKRVLKATYFLIFWFFEGFFTKSIVSIDSLRSSKAVFAQYELIISMLSVLASKAETYLIINIEVPI